MQKKIFTVPIGESGAAIQEMNAFLRGNKILEVKQEFANNPNGAYWCFCVRYIERVFTEGKDGKPVKKVDYKEVLDEVTLYRNHNNPDNRNHNIGFRLVFVP